MVQGLQHAPVVGARDGGLLADQRLVVVELHADVVGEERGDPLDGEDR